MSILVLQSSWWGRESSWLLCLICLPGVSWWLSVSGSSSQCHGVVCRLWLWYFLIILTYYFCLNLFSDYLCVSVWSKDNSHYSAHIFWLYLLICLASSKRQSNPCLHMKHDIIHILGCACVQAYLCPYVMLTIPVYSGSMVFSDDAQN